MFIGVVSTDDTIYVMISSGSELDSQQSYIIGEGLSKNGTKLLAIKLANLTLLELRNVLDIKQMDQSSINSLLMDLRDLERALVRTR